MKRNILIASALVLCAAFIIESCERSECSDSHVSTYNAHESKKMVGNCMGCHNPNGGGSGCFKVAGTAFDSIPGDYDVKNAVVKLYTQPNGMGELVVTLQVDSSGNFYTTSPISFGNGLYPSITSPSGTRYMPSPTITGACNGCHGVVNANLWAD